MAYALAADIQNEFKSVTFSDSPASNPSLTAVNSFISQVEAAMNGKIARKYLTPISSGASPDSFQIVKMISILIVAQRIRNILHVKSSDAQTTQGAGVPDDAKRGWAMVEDIVAGKLVLHDATLAVSNDGVDSFTADNAAPLPAVTVQPNFNVGVDSW